MSVTFTRFRSLRGGRPRRVWVRRGFVVAALAVSGVAALVSVPDASAANDLSGDVIPGSPVVDFQHFEPLRLHLSNFATPDAGAAALGFPTDLVFDADGRGYLAELTGSVRLIEPNGTVAATPVIQSTDYTDLPMGRDIGMTSVALHPDFLNPGTPGYGKLYTVESGIDHLQGIANGDPAGVNRLDPDEADFAPQYKPVGIDERFKANTEHRSGVFEYTVDPLNPAQGTTAKREVLLTHQFHHAHNLGDLLFDPRAQPGDPDYGLLFVSSADSGNGTRYQYNSNNPSTLPGALPADDSVYGRILRIDPLDPTAPGVDLTNRAVFFGTDPDERDDDLIAKFSVPTGPVANPLATDNGTVTGDDLTWAYGLRNPYRIYIDPEEPTGTTTIWSSETGQKNVEGIRTITAGSDGGWGLLEGGFFYLQNSDNGSTIPTLIQGLTEPELQNVTITVANGANGSQTRQLGNPEINRIVGVDFPDFQYDHTDGVSPMGGLIYRGQRLHELRGYYLFAEYQGNEDSMLTDPDGRTIGDQAVLLAAKPGDTLGRIYALSATLNSLDVPDRILGFAELPNGEPVVFGFNLGEFGPEGVVYRIGAGDRVIPEPTTAALLALALPATALRRRRTGRGRRFTA